MSDHGNGSGHSSEFEYVGGSAKDGPTIVVHHLEDPIGSGDRASVSPAADIQDDGVVTSAGDAVSLYLSSFVGDNVVQKFRDKKITFNMLASLTADDLGLLGIKNPKTRAKMVGEFSELPNQDESYVKMVERLDVQRFVDVFLGDMEEHHGKMKLLISSVLLKIKANAPNNITIGDKDYASKLCIDTIGLMSDELVELEKIIRTLSDDTNLEKQIFQKRNQAFIKYGVPITIISFVGFALFKHLKGKLF